ncbi:DUF4232 domain-containing protein [Streptomyces sp. RG80]|uniref:DUF4232 domain-containing protein n=1 Tax=Streptomyces sp. RG80 TaxID=3157340 RepID=UPI00338E1467
MRALPLAVGVVAAALLLTGCSDDGGDSGGKADADSGAKKSGSACTFDEMTVQVGPANAAPAVGDTGNVPVTLTNKGAACTLDGLPGVDLHAGATSATVAPDEAANAKKTTLTKGGVTSFTITYVRGEGGGTKSLGVKSATFTLPGSTDTHSFKWSYGDVALKSDGQAPDASVSGFQQTGD